MGDEITRIGPDGQASGLPLWLSSAGNACWRPGRSHQGQGWQHLAIELVVRGTMMLEVAGDRHRCPAGTVYLLHGRQQHRYHASDEGLLLKRYCNIEGPGLAALVEACGLLGRHLLLPHDARPLAALLRQAVALLGSDRAADERLRCGSQLAYALICEIARIPIDDRPALLREALVEMEAMIGEDCGVDDLAARLGVSTSQLGRVFRAGLGVSPGRHLRDLRLRRARILLASSGLSVAAIAARCGYPDATHFTHAFRREHGRPPSAYRGP